jgi:glucosamine--fructose-6-phosphate aminotransferase (isomerizing)
MLTEIAEQPAALERTIAEERTKISKLGNALKTRDIHLIVLVARGSSDNAALFGRYLLEITTGIPVSLSAPSVHTIYNADLRLDHALVVVFRSRAKVKTSTVCSKTRERPELTQSA